MSAIDFPNSPTNGQSFAAGNGATYVYQASPGMWVGSGSSSTTPVSSIIVNAKSFGAKGDGVTDDTSALQAAANYLAGCGGGRLVLDQGRFLINSANLNLARNVVLSGSWLMPGLANTPSSNEDFSVFKSAILLNPAYTIKFVGMSAGVEGVPIFNANVYNAAVPTTLRQNLDRVKLFAGTAITIGDGTGYTADDGTVRNTFILGFNTGIDINFASRPRIDMVAGDNHNGIHITECYDMNYFANIHFWPGFTTVGGAMAEGNYSVSGAANNGSGLIRITTSTAHVLATGDTNIVVTGVGGVAAANGTWTVTVIDSTHFDLQGSTFAGAYTSGGHVNVLAFKRKGIGIHLDTDTDWGQLTNCFTYSYQVAGIKVTNSNYTSLVNCGTDNYGPTLDTVPVGIWVDGTSAGAALVGCKTSAQGTNLRISTTATAENSVTVTNHRSWGAVVNAIEVLNGTAMLANCHVQPTNAPYPNTIHIATTADPVTFVGGDLTGVPFSYGGGALPAQIVSVRGIERSVLRGSLEVDGYLLAGIATVASLNSAATMGHGWRAFVYDATATTFNTVPVGGGANRVPVFSDGTSWRIG